MTTDRSLGHPSGPLSTSPITTYQLPITSCQLPITAFLCLHRLDAWGVSFIVAALALVQHRALTWQTGLLLAAITVHYWLGYWLNDYHDASRDRGDDLKARQNFFVRRPLGRRPVAAVAGLLFGLSALVFASFGWRGVVVALLNLLVIWAYSAPPLRLKSRPGLDLLAHAIFVQSWPYWICLWLIRASLQPTDAALLSICFLASLAGQLYQQVRDFDLDSATDTNFATRVGVGTALRALKACSLALLLLSIVALASGVLPWPLLPLGLLGLPKIVRHIVRRGRAAQRTYSPRLMYASMGLALAYTCGLLIWH